jgi:hypothetical protein
MLKKILHLLIFNGTIGESIKYFIPIGTSKDDQWLTNENTQVYADEHDPKVALQQFN